MLVVLGRCVKLLPLMIKLMFITKDAADVLVYMTVMLMVSFKAVEAMKGVVVVVTVVAVVMVSLPGFIDASRSGSGSTD